MGHAIASFGDLFFLPGNYALSVLLAVAPGFARLLGIGPEDYSGMPAVVLSAAIWLVLIVVLGAAYEQVRAADRAITAYVQRRYEAALQRGRMLRRWLIARAGRRKRGAQRAPVEDLIPLEAYELDGLELAALRSHAAVAPGYMLTKTDLALALGIDVSESERTLATLARLRLVDRSLGGPDGEEGYVLSRHGRSFLLARPRVTRM